MSIRTSPLTVHQTADEGAKLGDGAGTTAMQRPLCVDMDGTILATDALWESLLLLLKKAPLSLLLLPFWLSKGKAHFKREISRRVSLNAAVLPYRADVLQYLRDERASGRQIILATASDSTIAASIAEHLGLFTAVLASDGVVNLSGRKKLAAIQELIGPGGFDYIGDSKADLPIWRAADQAILVSPSSRLLKRASKSASVHHVFPSKGGIRVALMKAIRVHQWTKNVLLFGPVFMAHKAADIGMFTNAIWSFVAFSLCASSVYVLNDLLDLESDRQHPHKRERPFASGKLPIKAGVILAPLLLLASLIAAALLPSLFFFELLTYFAITLAYSFGVKQVVLLDVITLAGLYTIRVLAGGAATGVQISPWLLAFSMFLFLSLAFLKRYAELRMFEKGNVQGALKGRDYHVDDMELLRGFGPASGFLAILVLALYANSEDVRNLYKTPLLLWLTGPCLLYWVSRMWLLAHRGSLTGDPIVFTATDKVSYVIGAIILVVIVSASVF